MPDHSLEHVLAPIAVGPVELPNRIVSAAHVTGLAPGVFGDDFIAYHEARARGGTGLIVLEYAAVHQSSARGLDASDDRIVEPYRRLSEKLAPYPTRIFQQLNHVGRHAFPREGGPPWAMSAIPGVDGTSGQDVVPGELTHDQIAELVAAFARAAERVRDGGLHGVEIHAGHGFLLDQSLSPLANRRTDEYGGSSENRLRLTREVLAAVRAAVGGEIAVGLRISAEERGTRSVDDTAAIVRALDGEGLLDFLSVTFGQREAAETVAAMHEPHGWQLPKSTQVARAVGVPAIVTGRITTLAEAEEVIASGGAQLVSMVRAQIADPDLVAKSSAGRAAEVRPCIGCNHGCFAGVIAPPHRIGCAVNAGSGRELTHALEPAGTPRGVLVVGGGPAGLEAARVAALRGHRVVLCEAEDRLGGQVTLARRAPLREDIGRIVDWLESELARLGVDVRTGVAVDRAFVRELAPDAVVVATGSRPRRDGFRIAAQPEPLAGPVLSSRDVLAHGPPGGSVVVVDDLGHYEAVAVVDHVLAGGASVRFVTRFATVAPLVDPSLSAGPARARFARHGVALHLRSTVDSVGEGSVTVRDLDSNRDETVEAEAVVLVSASIPERRLAAELAGDGVEVRVIGEAAAQRFLLGACHDGFAAGRAL